jgi:hypothetical protein
MLRRAFSTCSRFLPTMWLEESKLYALSMTSLNFRNLTDRARSGVLPWLNPKLVRPLSTLKNSLAACAALQATSPRAGIVELRAKTTKVGSQSFRVACSFIPHRVAKIHVELSVLLPLLLDQVETLFE